MITKALQKNGTVVLRMSKGDYRLLQWVIQTMVNEGNSADQIDKIAHHIAPYLGTI